MERNPLPYSGVDRAALQAIYAESVASLREAGKIAERLRIELPDSLALAGEALSHVAAGAKETGAAAKYTLNEMRSGYADIRAVLEQLARDRPAEAVVEPKFDWADDRMLLNDIRAREGVYGPLWD